MENLPDDIPVLKGMVSAFSDEKRRYSEDVRRYTEENRRYEIENKLLREQVLLLKSKLFGRKTEKLPADGAEQQILFDEPSEGKSEKAAESTITVPEHTRKKSGRKPLPAAH